MSVLAVWGFATIVASWYPRAVDPRVATVLAWTTVGLVLAALAFWSYIQIVVAPAYGTDEVPSTSTPPNCCCTALNPYTHSMAPAFSLFHVSPNGYTFRLNGRARHLALVPVPVLPPLRAFPRAGWSTPDWRSGAQRRRLGLGIVLAFALLPRPVRPLAIVVGSLSVYIGYAVGRRHRRPVRAPAHRRRVPWDRFATEPRSGGLARTGPARTGHGGQADPVAGASLPGRSGSRWRLAACGSGSAAGGPRAGTSPSRWAPSWFPTSPSSSCARTPGASGVLTPIAGHAVPAGQGLVGLSLFLGCRWGLARRLRVCAGGGVPRAPRRRTWPSIPSLKRGPWSSPPSSSSSPARSFGSYLVMLLPAALVAAYTVSPARWRSSPPWRPRGRGWHSVAPSPRRAAVAAVFLIGPPLDGGGHVGADHRSAGHGGPGGHRGDEPLERTRPARLLGGERRARHAPSGAGTGHPTGSRPDGTAHYMLLAPNFFAQPPITGGFQVVAFTARPATSAGARPTCRRHCTSA